MWRIVAGLVLIGTIHLLPVIAAMRLSDWLYNPVVTLAWTIQMTRGMTPEGVLILLFSFVGLAIGPMVVVRLLHDRRAATLFGPARAAWADFLRVSGPLLLLAAAMTPFYALADDAQPNLALGPFLFWLPFALTGLLIQTGAEELVFRGYLQQQLAARSRSPLVWMVIPTVMFAFGHYAPEEYGDNALLLVAWAALFGLLAADLTARTGNLGAAIGLHFANNAAAMLFVGVEGNMSGLALFTIRADLTAPGALPLLAVDFATMLVSWLLCRVLLRR